jgi:signal transduction histidine kinase
MTSPRRIKQVQVLSIFTFGLAFVWYLLSRQLVQNQLSLWILLAALCFLLTVLLLKFKWFNASRVLYLLAFNVSVVTTASYIGPLGNVEFILLFALGLPFLMFSFRTERFLLVFFAALPLIGWTALFVTDFNLVSSSSLDPELARSVFYPVSLISTFVLVGFQTTYFAYVNASYYAHIRKKRVEAEEASTAKSRFLSTMSHEIRTPLNGIIGLSHIIQDSNPRPDQKDNVDALNYSGKLLMQLLNNVLDYSKMEVKEFQLDRIATDLNLAFRQLHKIHEPNCLGKGISIHVEIDEGIPLVWIDVVRFNQVLNNLINNAIKFTAKGGVTVKLKVVSETDDALNLLVEVIDTGVGVAADKQAEIFEAFKQEDSSIQTKYGGTGLGLSIVKEIVQLMGTEIEIESQVGKGSTFKFELPLKRVVGEEIKKFDKKPGLKINGLRVLLVEDNEINELVGRQILEKEGIIVDSAGNGKDAVEMVRNNNYDLVLMDIQMPVMDGYESSLSIRNFNTNIGTVCIGFHGSKGQNLRIGNERIFAKTL